MDLLIILGIIAIPAIAQIGISVNYSKYKNIENSKKLSGFDVARKILDKNGLQNVHVVEVRGNLTDHYDPSRKVVRLSSDIFHGESVAAIAVAAHECGHAIQDKENYNFLRFRSMLFPIVRISNYFSYIVLLLGFLFEAVNLFSVGIALVTLGLVFQIITLPVEYNASSRAKKELESVNIISPDEMVGVTKVLSSAAMTYVAGVLSNALDLLRLILLFSRRND
ncbi:MAG TPA: zinc metallopeptidase [Bacilli bacterium]|jgi:hypothetical protein|nr:zinc metallopeptidase [Bacilli bacterium]